MLAFLPLFFDKAKKHQILVFYIAVGYSVLVCFARLLVGAHHLSDVSMGSLLMFGFMFLANEVLIKMNIEREEE